jgi:hypothetical protein
MALEGDGHTTDEGREHEQQERGNGGRCVHVCRGRRGENIYGSAAALRLKNRRELDKRA